MTTETGLRTTETAARTTETATRERRRETRIRWDDAIRWKRPGTIEDNKGWAQDQAESGYGFIATRETAPSVGDCLNLRRFDRDRWAIINQTVRVARIGSTSSAGLVIVGCAIDDIGDSDAPGHTLTI